MLLQFNYKNFKSFRDDTTLDLTATKISEFNNHLKFPRSFSLVSPIISKSHLEKNRIIDKMLRRL